MLHKRTTLAKKGRETTMDRLNIRDFDIADWQDEARVDRLCVELLKHFHNDLLKVQQCEALEAGSLARGADYFLREFIIGDRQENLFEIEPKRVRQFAGNWYIIRNMEPNMEELTDLLFGIDAFYCWCTDNSLFNGQKQKEIHRLCRSFDDYRMRIETFWEITENYDEWDSAVSLKD
jgi:hypothetical protein